MYQYPKTYRSTEELLQKLRDSGMIISSQQEAIVAIDSIGYYRLRGYFYHLFDWQTHRYQPGTRFDDVLKLYNFDTELSHLLFNFLSKIEVALRARFVKAFQLGGDVLALNDPSCFKDKKRYWNNQGTIANEIARSNDVFIEHNFQNHDGAIPIWATVEILSFGTLSKLIKNLATGKGTAFSHIVSSYTFKKQNDKIITPSHEMFSSWVQTVSVMRNICAHNSRIYNRTINTVPKLIEADATGASRYNGLYQVVLAMKYLRPSDQEWKSFVDGFNSLLEKYAGVFDLRRMNFPDDWKMHFLVIK